MMFDLLTLHFDQLKLSYLKKTTTTATKPYGNISSTTFERLGFCAWYTCSFFMARLSYSAEFDQVWS
jgi:hypothetical protein